MGSMGKKGRKNEATAMLSTFPKFELVPISKYFITLPKALRPSMMPSCRTRRPGSTRITSAESRATSTALETEMPTSAACSEGASLMPSPMNPTAWPLCLRAKRIRFFCAGDMRANTLVSSTSCPSAGSVIRSSSSPVRMWPECDSYLRADVTGDAVIVPGDNLDLNTILL